MKDLIYHFGLAVSFVAGALWLPVEYYYFDGSANKPNLYWVSPIPLLAVSLALIYVSIVNITIFFWGIINDL